jgi:hypothetical protein
MSTRMDELLRSAKLSGQSEAKLLADFISNVKNSTDSTPEMIITSLGEIIEWATAMKFVAEEELKGRR